MTTTSATTSIVTALGSGSGIDMNALAQSLAEATYAQRVANNTTKSDALTSKISTASSIKSQVSSLSSAIADRVRTGDLAPTPTIGNSGVATVTRATSGTSPSGTSYSLEVSQIATAQSLVSPAYSASTSTVGGGTLTLRFGTIASGSFTADGDRDAVDITIPAGATLAQVAQKINAANTGVTAYVVNSSEGAKLVYKGQEGAENGFVVEASETAGDEGLGALAWEPSTGAANQLLGTAVDAEFKFDGVTMKSSTNAVGEVAPGISLKLTGTNAGNPTTIGFSDPTSGVTSMMTDLVSALNEIVSALTSAMDSTSGDLSRDDGARALRSALSSLGSTVIMPNATGNSPKTLAELGLSIGRDGTFSLNSTTLANALARDPEGVSAMFTNGLYGVYATFDKISRATSTAGNPGSLAGSLSRYQTQQTAITKDNSKIADQQEALRSRLATQLTAADSQIATLKSTQSYLAQQIAQWNKSSD